MSATSLVRVAIHGPPRSGTTWIGEIVNSSPRTIVKYQPLFSYALKDYLSPGSSLYCSIVRKTPAAMTVPMTPARLGPMANIRR